MAETRRFLETRPYAFALGLALALLAVDVVLQPSFGASASWAGDLAAFAPLGLAAMASTPSIVSGGGGLDISIGPLIIVVNIFLVVVLMDGGAGNVWLDVPVLLAIGAAIGAVNGILVARLRYLPVIATLCTFFVLGGLGLELAPNPHTATPVNWTVDLAGKIGPIPGALLLLAVPPLIWFLLGRTPYRRTLYAVGGNDATAFSAGVDVASTRIVAYALGGLFAALGGIALTALVQSSQSNLATQYTLPALAAVALGGTPLGGGRGGLLGSVLGAASIYLLQTLLTEVHVSSTWLELVYGALLLGGVVLGARLSGTHREAVA